MRAARARAELAVARTPQLNHALDRQRWQVSKRVTTRVFELEGARINDLDGFYAEVSRVLIPGAEWGHNLDAFDDVLCGGFGLPEGGFTLVWHESEQSRVRLGHVETVRVLEQRLGHCHPDNRLGIAERIDAARKGEGQTIFDDLLEIIGGHPEIELVLK